MVARAPEAHQPVMLRISKRLHFYFVDPRAFNGVGVFNLASKVADNERYPTAKARLIELEMAFTHRVGRFSKGFFQ
jgi:hypothetical protein